MKKNALLSWVKEGSITVPSFLFSYYKKIGLTDVECMLLLQIYSFLEKGYEFPTHHMLSERMILSEEQCAQTVGSLLQRGYLKILKGEREGILMEKYSLDPLWEKLVDQHVLEQLEKSQQASEKEEKSLYTIFEQEFGRPLSPMEIETLSMWIDNDKYSPELIKAALREAVLSNKLNFRYIDRILFEWQKKGIKRVEEAMEQGKKVRSQYAAKTKEKQEMKKKTDTIPFYNWLEN